MTVLVTGGYGFIGSNFINSWYSFSDEKIVNIDKLTYAANKTNILHHKNHIHYNLDINDTTSIINVINQHSPRAIIHFAAESHVDNSIENPNVFIETNVLGTASLLNAILKTDRTIKFIHVSTDEVYGSLGLADPPSMEDDLYLPNSPYAASKASSDLIVRSYHKTYGLQTVITNCSNNYGVNQHSEKFIPTVIQSCLDGKNIPIYGDGKNVRDWLSVDDHCSALRLILEKGKIGQKYNIGGTNQFTNIEVVNKICELLDLFVPKTTSYKELISFVTDRLGHDKRYDIDCTKLKSELGWQQSVFFNEGLEKLVKWHINRYFKL